MRFIFWRYDLSGGTKNPQRSHVSHIKNWITEKVCFSSYPMGFKTSNPVCYVNPPSRIHSLSEGPDCYEKSSKRSTASISKNSSLLFHSLASIRETIIEAFPCLVIYEYNAITKRPKVSPHNNHIGFPYLLFRSKVISYIV